MGILARAVRPFAMTTTFRAELAIESEGDERVDVGTGNGVDGPALASVASVRAAARNELLAPEAHGAGTAVPGLYEDVDFVDEHQELFYWQDADSAPPRAVVFKPHTAADLREERVVFAQPDVQSGREPSSALPHQNRSAGHDVAVVTLDAQPLRVAVAAVA